MIWILENFNPNQIWVLSFFPVIGLVFQYVLSPKTIKTIGIIALLLSLPVFTGYDFVFSWLYEICTTLIAGALFAFFLSGMNKHAQKIITTIIVTVLLSIIFALLVFLSRFTGYQQTVDSWKKGSYTVKYVSDQGFSGRPLMKYEVYHTPIFGLYNKKIQGIGHLSEDYNQCVLTFEKANVEFDKCSETIISAP